jgi:hypothetical protein
MGRAVEATIEQMAAWAKTMNELATVVPKMEAVSGCLQQRRHQRQRRSRRQTLPTLPVQLL